MNIELDKMETRVIHSELNCSEGPSHLLFIWKGERTQVSSFSFHLKKLESGVQIIRIKETKTLKFYTEKIIVIINEIKADSLRTP